MTLYEFNALDAEEKIAKAMQGKFVDVRVETSQRIVLYSHPEFYAEVFYDAQDNRIIKARAFTSLAPLADYIRL